MVMILMSRYFNGNLYLASVTNYKFSVDSLPAWYLNRLVITVIYVVHNKYGPY